MEHERNDPHESARRAASWAGVPLVAAAWQGLERYAGWLVEEAIPAGGLGPREADRVWDRHIADSLTFARPWGDSGPASLLDVGSGVGLPGIPLALVYPATRVMLLDRGGRRTRMLDRIVRILELPGVAVIRRQAGEVSGRFDGVTFRASLPPPDALALSARLLLPDGVAVLGLSRRAERPDGIDALVGTAGTLDLDLEVVSVPPEVLDAPSWLLMIRRSGHTSPSG